MPRLAKNRDSYEIGARIKSLRTSRKLSQTELAGRLDVSYQQVQKYETGRNNIAVPMMKRIAAALQCDPCQICGCCNDKPNA